MSSMVTIKNGDFYYHIPTHEYSRYWLPELEKSECNPIPYNGVLTVKKIPNTIPYPSRLAALKRGKGVKRVTKAYESKGSGKHANTTYTNG